MSRLPTVLVLATRPIALGAPDATSAEPYELDCQWQASDDDLASILARERPDVIVSFGPRSRYPRLAEAPNDIRRRWLHFDRAEPTHAELQAIGALVLCYAVRHALVPDAAVGRPPLVSVFTPAYRPGERIQRAYRSLASQSFDNWEWVVVDDSGDEGETWRALEALARTDPRLSIHLSTHSGRIGEVKRRACSLARGDILVELDHDDELTPNALADIVAAFERHPEAGFVYSDWAEVDERTGASLTYPPGWAFGFGRYRTESFRARPLHIAIAPPVNETTIRHIVSTPNHVRAWRRESYWQIGGHNPRLHVADDYDLVVRTFLRVPMIHVPRLCYIQYLNSGTNTQARRRPEIQLLVHQIRDHYEHQIRERLQELQQAEVAVGMKPPSAAPAPSSRAAGRNRPLAPEVSVIIPTFARPELCVRAVRSALAQDWENLEVVVVGDACARFDSVMRAVGDDPRVRSVWLPVNKGGARARNDGIQAAAGEWIAYLDDDNVWTEEHLSSVMAAIRRTGASWGFSSMCVPDGTDLGFVVPVRGGIDTSCIVHAKRLIRDYGRWMSSDEAGDYAVDWVMVSRWLEAGEPWVATGQPTLVYNTETSGQASFVLGLAAARRGAPNP